ncbi:STAS domain-containing protein [Streptomyces boluensis]|uniref:STAS domain-containing protein n=1 Tax=Streptomyces boluensis TaxID=1775135 RepID=A0A964UKM6_9ACTN|nr:STAS domain-containing protein [Streptomyces boluensis]NBE50801.1 STAS domain-containing protein [Streptomyces boluensis]
MSRQNPRLTISTIASCDDTSVLRAKGELDQSCESYFLAAVGTSINTGHQHLVLDVTPLTFCDSRGLNCLLATRWLLQRRDGKLLLAGAGQRLAELLAQTGSSALLPAYPSVSQALAQLPEASRPTWPPAPHSEHTNSRVQPRTYLPDERAYEAEEGP